MNLQDFMNKRKQAEVVIKIYEQLLLAIEVPDNDDALYGMPEVVDVPVQIVRDGIRSLIMEQRRILLPLNEYEIYEICEVNKGTTGDVKVDTGDPNGEVSEEED